MALRTRTGCRATISSRADVHPRRDLLQLPRRARDGEQRRSDKAGQRSVPGVPWAEVAERAARRDYRGAHASQGWLRGDECIGCHMPKIEQTIADVNVRSHTFKFIPPASTDLLKVPNACTMCHTDKPTSWATDNLKSWGQFSAWRVGN